MMYGEEYLKRRLTDPPRHIPLAVTIHLLLGGILSLFGWIFFGFGMIFFWVFAMNCDPTAWFVFRGDLETAPGVIISAEPTSFSEGGSEHTEGTPIYGYRYRFDYRGESYSGISYRLGAQAEVAQTATIEFPAERPERSRVQGYRTAPFTPLVLFVVIFPAIGLAIVLGKLFIGRRHRYLLKYGELARGRLVAKESTNTSINNQPVYKLTFEFETSMGRKEQIVVKTHNVRPLEDDERETLLYAPTKASYGTTLDHLPGRPRITEDGSIAVRSGPSAYFSLIVPALSIVGHGTYVLLRFVV